MRGGPRGGSWAGAGQEGLLRDGARPECLPAWHTARSRSPLVLLLSLPLTPGLPAQTGAGHTQRGLKLTANTWAPVP